MGIVIPKVGSGGSQELYPVRQESEATMPIDDSRPAIDPGRPVSRLVVAATFTAEPLQKTP